jgi:hypothetical protein
VISYNNRACLCLPEHVNNRALAPADMLVVPVPRLRVDGLTDAAKHAQRAPVMRLDVVHTEVAQQADHGRCGVELC